MFAILLAMLATQVEPADRGDEGDWYVLDTTDNNTGEREVYAMNTFFEGDDFVSLAIRCTAGRPTFFVDWDKMPFPDQAVLTIGPVADPDAEPQQERYVFEKSKDVVERGLRASPETTARIVSAIGGSKYMTITAHLTTGQRTVGVPVDGAQRAWSRVVRHCPVKLMTRPPV